jgi:hypothetical protein
MPSSHSTAHIVVLTALAMLLMLVMLPVMAQPPLETAWLCVHVLDADNHPVKGTLKATLVPVTAKSAVGETPTLTPDGVEFVGISAGDYTLTLTLTGTIEANGPTRITVAPGPNVYEWHPEKTVTVSGILSVAQATPSPSETTDTSKVASSPIVLQTVLMLRDRAGKGTERRIYVTPTLSGGRWALAGLITGSYRLLLMTDYGCAATSFDVTSTGASVDGGALDLQPGITVALNCSNADKTPTVCAALTLRLTGPVDAKSAGMVYDLAAQLTLTGITDQQGNMTFPQLPPGKYKWTAKDAVTGGTCSGNLVAATQATVTVIFPAPKVVSP